MSSKNSAISLRLARPRELFKTPFGFCDGLLPFVRTHPSDLGNELELTSVKIIRGLLTKRAESER